MFDKNIFGERIKEIRLANNLQQSEFGAKLGLTKHAVSKMETGKNAASIEVLYKICKLFNVSADELLGLKDNDRN
jgi:transcriptional regulator with XRE-family HTH domain